MHVVQTDRQTDIHTVDTDGTESVFFYYSRKTRCSSGIVTAVKCIGKLLFFSCSFFKNEQ